MAPNYKLIYFDFPGRAEVTRLLFAYGNIKYEDSRFSFADWSKYKPGKSIFQHLNKMRIDSRKKHIYLRLESGQNIIQVC